MKTFLVMLRHSADDIPVAVYSGRDGLPAKVAKELAFSIAKKTRPKPTKAVSKALGVEASTPISVCVCEFHDGLPFKYHLVKEFE